MASATADNNHRKLRGPRFGLYDIFANENNPTLCVGAGLPFWYEKGALIRDIIETAWKEEHRKSNYKVVFTPHIGQKHLWDLSEHTNYFSQKMFGVQRLESIHTEVEAEYCVRPMNCPFHIMIYEAERRRAQDLPFRVAELGTVYRYEQSGDLTGLLRVRGFTQDDAHIFCRWDQIEQEISEFLGFARDFLRWFGFDENNMNFEILGDSKGRLDTNEFVRIRKILEDAFLKVFAKSLQRGKQPAVYYGVQLNGLITDSKGTSWECLTVQIDTLLPDKFKLEYAGANGKSHEKPIIIHRTIMGSLERFIALLVEHHSNGLPAWLSPVQAWVIPISAHKHLSYGERVTNTLKKAGLRAEVDRRNESVDRKKRDALTRLPFDRPPYILVIGDKEEKENTVSLELRSGESLGSRSLPEFIELAREVIDRKLVTLLPN